ncbi:MAG: hypothetical protein SFU27_14190 [Thermonemataceae bacterium]|nr:hypothetical protein [Thermonemataceae bacterium]
MKKITAVILLIAVFTACKKEENSEKRDLTEQKTAKSPENNAQLSETEQKNIDEQSETIPAPPDYAKLILGRWELKEDRNFWAFYEKDKVFGDGNEQGTTYKIDMGKITYGSGGEEIILSINEKEMVTQANGTNQTWIKTDLNKPEQNLSKIDPKKLVGLWDLEGGDEFSSIRFKANGYCDLVPYNDYYTYKIKGNKILYKKTPNAPNNANAEPVEEIIQLDDKTLVIKRDASEFRYKKSANK